MVNAQNESAGFSFFIFFIYLMCVPVRASVCTYDNLILELTQGNCAGVTFTNRIKLAFTFAKRQYLTGSSTKYMQWETSPIQLSISLWTWI